MFVDSGDSGIISRYPMLQVASKPSDSCSRLDSHQDQQT
jgi:hypothetical protein